MPSSASGASPAIHLKDDLLSGFLVFLIALPLCLGISMASGFPPVAGVMTAVVGGVVVTWIGSARLTIKGPAAGLIVIAIGAVTELGGGDATTGYRRALAVGVVAAVIQIGLALARAGALGDVFPPSVIHGMLAAIGVIIMSKQAHTVLGVVPEAKEPLRLIAEVPHSIAHLNPEIAVIGGISLLILFGLPLFDNKWVKRIPAPLVVLVVAMPLGLYFDLDHQHTYSFHNHDYMVGPNHLVQLPGSILRAVATPDFSVVTSGTSIKYVIMFALVGSIESLLSVNAVDALDPEKHASDLNKDLLATGVGNLVAAAIGGLPMISEIVRSKANIDSGAKSRVSNFFHGLFLLLFVALAPGLLHQIPLAALGAMLVYTGARLASPLELVRTYRIGAEQLLIFVVTLFVTLATDLLLGVAAGLVLKIIIHLKNGASIKSLFSVPIEQRREGDRLILVVRQAAVFTNLLGLKKRLLAIDGDVREVVVDFSDTWVVDHTVLERLHGMAREWPSCTLAVTGLSRHVASSPHEHAARRRLRAPTESRA